MQTFEELKAWLRSFIGEGRRFESVAAMARYLGIYNQSHAKLYNTLNKDRDPSASAFLEWISRMGARILTPEDYARTGQRYYTVAKVVPRIHNQKDMCFAQESRTEGWVAFQYKWLASQADPGSCILFEVTEQAMQPTLREGDMVLVDRKQTEVYSSKIYAIAMEDTVCLRRIEKRPGALILRSDDPAYPNEVIEGEQREAIMIIGRVIWASREF